MQEIRVVLIIMDKNICFQDKLLNQLAGQIHRSHGTLSNNVIKRH